ncbi:MAG: 16S rRNA (cytidine(1402)-2'-O)-methyltransferase [Eubacteriales bacterium]|nr:16S rRNA (cytidine(1402)-2'-O)-methyltransferase [Eubacteriales bacterium]MDD4717155.1 16S rRNA (cytidine(1402)-2'-O)-methyltransferase [Eubacteriales bacterium]
MTDKGTLFIVGTPIGNLADFSQRASDVLSEVSRIAAEDTRRTGILLKHLGIDKPLMSFHEHNKSSRSVQIIRMLLEGADIALVSDAGMPCISDPGYELVALCYESRINVTVVPGPCAAITALAGSGFEGSRFTFEGFLPVKGRERKIRIDSMIRNEITSVIYEAPHRLIKTLSDIRDAGRGERSICVARELTKKYEEFWKGSVDEAIDRFSSVVPKGEFVIMIEGYKEEHAGFDDDTEYISDRICRMFSEGASAKDIVIKLSAETGMKRNELYKMINKTKNSNFDQI